MLNEYKFIISIVIAPILFMIHLKTIEFIIYKIFNTSFEASISIAVFIVSITWIIIIANSLTKD